MVLAVGLVIAAVAAPCHAGATADRFCTPGASLAHVTTRQVCTPGWSDRHGHVNDTQRQRIFHRYGIPTRRYRQYELDHLIALEVGGSNVDGNLWPEPGPSPNPKDRVETRLHQQVCEGQITLPQAQQRLVASWSRPPRGGVVALWHMDETSGSVMHDATRSHDGSLQSVVRRGLPGFSGAAYGLGSGYVSVPWASDLNPGDAKLTVTVHLKTTSVPATPDWDLVRKGYATTAGGAWKMEYQPSGQASCGFRGSGKYHELRAGPALNDDRWHTLQCVKTASAISLVVDGQAFSQTVTIGSIANTSRLVFGAHSAGREYFEGALDEASIRIG